MALIYYQNPKIIVAFGRNGEWQRAVSTLGRMRRSGAIPDAHSFAMAMKACAEGGQPRQALSLLEELKREGGDVRPTTVVYNTLLGLCRGKSKRGGGGNGGVSRSGGRGQGEAARDAPAAGIRELHMDEMVHRNGFASIGSSGVNGGITAATAGLIESKAVNIPTVAGASCGVTDWGYDCDELATTAVTLLREMTVAGGACAPDKMSFELVMQACFNAGYPQKAIKVFRAMRRWGMATARGRRAGGVPEAYRVRPERATYRLGLTAAAAAGDGPAAAVMLEEMRNAGMVLDEVN